MKLVTAIIKPHKVEEVKDALTGAGVQGITLSEVRGFGRQRGHTEVYRGTEYQVDFVPKARLEILVDEAGVDRIVEAVVATARTGQVGDGKVFVTDVERVVRIRTGDEGVEAI